MKGLEELLPGQVYDSPITAIRNYRRKVSDPLMKIGISVQGFLYDLDTGVVLTKFPTVNIPYMTIITGIDNGETINYLVVTTAGQYPHKWNGVVGDPTTQVGYQALQFPVVATPNSVSIIGYLPAAVGPTRYTALQLLVGRKYRVTRWNPNTKHETSPSDDNLFTTPDTASMIEPDADITKIYITQVAIGLSGEDATANADAIAAGYTRLRVYATRDGGNTFYLCDNALSVTQIIGFADVVLEPTDSDGSIAISPFNMYFDGVILSSTQYPNGVMVSPTPDSSLVQPAPELGQNDLPPCAIWGGSYQSRIWFVDANQPNRLMVSNVGDFESYSVNNDIILESDNSDPITFVNEQSNQLIVAKSPSMASIINADPMSMTILPLYAGTGVVGRRAGKVVRGVLFYLSQTGIMAYAGGLPNFYGKPIKQLIDGVLGEYKLEKTILCYSEKDDLVLLATVVALVGPVIFIASFRESIPFSMYLLPTEATALNDIEFSGGEIDCCIALADNRVYHFRRGDTVSNVDLTPFQALLETQLLPQEDLYSRKVFRNIRIEGSQLDGFEFRCSTDDTNVWSPWEKLFEFSSPIGLVGKMIKIQIRHIVLPTPTLPFTLPPTISNMMLEYVVIGDSR